MKFLFTSLVAFQMAVGFAAHAQVATLSLMGNVQSEDQQALSGAAVTVIHVPSGVRHAAASDRAGRFMIPNLMVGGPYMIRVGEGGYRPQTVENIFLEAGKTANFTVVLNKLNREDNKKGNNRNAVADLDPNATTMTLAPEAVVGGPVLVTIAPKNSKYASSNSPARTAPAPANPTLTASTAPAPADRNPAASRPEAKPVVPTAVAAPVATAPTRSAMPAPMSAPTTTPASAPASVPGAAPATETKKSVAPSRYSRRPYTPNRPYAPRKVTDPIVPGHFDAKSGNYIYHTGAPTTLKLANGATLAGVGVNSTESYLHRFLADPAAKVDTADLTNGWYNFDRVFFTPGKATLTPESMGQLRNIATILKAYPNARVKLGGYTDSTGTYQVNRQLSEARARTAWASLVDMGISPSRIEARGYGPRYSISANNSEAGRAMNRRLSVKVLQK